MGCLIGWLHGCVVVVYHIRGLSAAKYLRTTEFEVVKNQLTTKQVIEAVTKTGGKLNTKSTRMMTYGSRRQAKRRIMAVRRKAQAEETASALHTWLTKISGASTGVLRKKSLAW